MTVMSPLNVVLVCLALLPYIRGQHDFSNDDMRKLRQRTKDMFQHAYIGYMKNAYPHDELRPLTCDGVNTWGNFSLTLVDALDTLAIMGNYEEFRRVASLVLENLNPNLNVNVSVFETNIRVIGGLLSAHLLSRRAGIVLEEGWPCSGPLLRLAERFAEKLLPAFRTKTGMPYGTVNLLHGVDPQETPETCTAAVGTYILEFGTLSRLTGNPIYEETALQALSALNSTRSDIGLLGNHINVQTGEWTAVDAGIGAGVDSLFEYLVKGANLLRRNELMAMFEEYSVPIKKYLNHGDWYFWVNMKSGSVTLPIFQSLEAFWPGIEVLTGKLESAYETLLNYFTVWRKFGMTPEFYSIMHEAPYKSREGYPLRPELVESIMYMYRATKDALLLQMGKQILHSIEATAKTECGYATIKDVRDHTIENRMESFFLAETTKYLYLLFDPNHFLHGTGQNGQTLLLKDGTKCIVEAGGYIFNTEAHPIDPAALACCYSRQQDLKDAATIIESLDIGEGFSYKFSPKGKRTDPTEIRQHKFPRNQTTTGSTQQLSCPVPSPHFQLYAYGEIWSEL